MTRSSHFSLGFCAVKHAAAVCLALLFGRPVVAAEANAVHTAAQTITAAELKRHIDVLADDSFEGRRGGSRGGRAAGGYLAAELEKAGLKGMGDDGTFFQTFAGGERNLIAIWEGSDPELKKQYVFVGAHYDHVGYGNSSNSYGPTGYIHNGADDNASGVAGLLELVQAITTLPQRPKRSVLFALWDGEEEGLLGSKHWVSRPTVPLKDIVLYINLDMIGRLRKERVEVYGTRSSPGLRQFISRQNDAGKLWLDFTWEMKENSDHYSFFERDIPMLMFHTGLHDNYHRPSDDAHLINNEGAEHVARLIFAVVGALADSDRPLRFRPESRREDPAGKRAFEQALPPPPPRFGLEWNEAMSNDAGVVVSRVTAGLPAAKAGLKRGDRITKFDGQPVTAQFPLRLAVLAAPSPVEVEVLREGEAEPQKLQIALAGSPTRLGIAWRDDPGEPGAVLLTQVIYGSAAHQAGLSAKDRIYEVNGQTFASSSEFRKLVTAPGPLELLIERSGRLYKLPLTPVEFAAK